jgi:hypothetical protein
MLDESTAGPSTSLRSGRDDNSYLGKGREYPRKIGIRNKVTNSRDDNSYFGRPADAQEKLSSEIKSQTLRMTIHILAGPRVPKKNCHTNKKVTTSERRREPALSEVEGDLQFCGFALECFSTAYLVMQSELSCRDGADVRRHSSTVLGHIESGRGFLG